jgi:Family of unknown function (DUF6879)
VQRAVTYLSEEQFFELFHTFNHTAFRLEVRESYVGVDEAAYRQFLSGDLPTLDSLAATRPHPLRRQDQ